MLMKQVFTNWTTYSCLSKKLLNIPPIPLLFPRESKKACKITGYDMPAQSKVTVNIWGIGREPINWTEPERYSIQRDFLIVQWIIRGLILNSSHLVLEYCLVWLLWCFHLHSCYAFWIGYPLMV